MVKKRYDIAVKTGSYTDRNGDTKNRYENVGVMLEGDKGPYLMMKRTFNPAGVPSDRDTILLSLFEPKDEQQAQPRGGGGGHHSTPVDLDDDSDSVPF